MNEEQVVAALSALGHQHRLQIFRRLVVAGMDGIPAGEIAEAVGISPTALSFHIKELAHAGLVTATKEGRFVRYALRVEGMRQLLSYLTEDCCGGSSELCGSAAAQRRDVCRPKPGRKRA